jgi:hypothetical protein
MLAALGLTAEGFTALWLIAPIPLLSAQGLTTPVAKSKVPYGGDKVDPGIWLRSTLA